MKILRKVYQYKVIFFLTFFSILFFSQFIFSGKIPIPADSIVGLYHPFRDYYLSTSPQGIPVKNPLATDPVRQQYPWRLLAIDQLKKLSLPLWNPYSFAGTPLLGNFQSAPFYPLNILFFFFAPTLAWSILVFLQPLLSSYFMYRYLRHMRLSIEASTFAGIIFAYSGFSIAWLTWTTIGHTLLWLPLILLAKEHILEKVSWKWIIILLIAEISSVFAGHLQTLFYCLVVSNIYLFVRIIQRVNKDSKKRVMLSFIKVYFPFLLCGLLVLVISSIQWLPTFQFVNLSNRLIDQTNYLKEGWFIPWRHIIQFFVVDFFGNPTTYNYWGTWNYSEFVGYIGILPLFFIIYLLFQRKDMMTVFFVVLGFIAGLFAFPTYISQLPFKLNLPFISTSQPTRLLSIIDFSLSILAGLGLDKFMKETVTRKKSLIYFFPILIIFSLAWIFSIKAFRFFSFSDTQQSIIQRNLIFPSIIFVISVFLVMFIAKKQKRIFFYLVILIVILDLFRFGWKYVPFSDSKYLFPTTHLIARLQKNIGNYRIMTLDRRILAPNFASYYHLQDVSGYDPLYLKRYAQFVGFWQRGKADLSPVAYNRIITPEIFESEFTDLLGVKYLLSLKDEKSEKLKLIDREGETRLYENTKVLPRVFLSEKVFQVKNDQQEVEVLFQNKENLKSTVTIQQRVNVSQEQLDSNETAHIKKYADSEMEIEVSTTKTRLLVITDVYYPTWKAYLDTRETPIYQVDYLFRGILVPSGHHLISLKNKLF